MIGPAPALDGRVTDMMHALAEAQRLPSSAVRHQLERFDVTVCEFFAGVYEVDGAPGVVEAYHVVAVLEELGCAELIIPLPERRDPVCLVGRRVDGRGFEVTVARLAWNLGRETLLDLLGQQLGTAGPRLPVAPASSGAPPTVPPVDITLSGHVSQLPIVTLLETLCQNQRTGALRLGLDGTILGTIYIEDGAIVHARTSAVEGEPAVAHLASAEDAYFAFTTESPVARTIHRPATAVLLDTARMIDERQRA